MFAPHYLSWAETTTLLAALGLLATASAEFYRMKKSAEERRPQALRIPARRGPQRKPRI